MNKVWQIVINLVLYAFLGWLMWDSTVSHWDPWFAFTVGFVLVLAGVITFVPSLHAAKVSPGAYPYDD